MQMRPSVSQDLIVAHTAYKLLICQGELIGCIVDLVEN